MRTSSPLQLHTTPFLMHSDRVRALLYSSALAVLLLAFLPPKPRIVFPKVQEHHFGFSFWMSVISTFSFATFTSSIDFIKLLFPLFSASFPLICPRVHRVLLSSGPSVLNPLQSTKPSLPSGCLTPGPAGIPVRTQGGTGQSWTVLHHHRCCCSAHLCRCMCSYAKLRCLCLHQCFSSYSQLPQPAHVDRPQLPAHQLFCTSGHFCEDT